MWKILKGTSRNNAEIDSTFTDRRKALRRLASLKNSFRGKRLDAWLVPAEPDDPVNMKPEKSEDRHNKGYYPRRIK